MKRKQQYLTFIIQYRAGYRGKVYEFEVDAMGALDALNTFILAARSRTLGRRAHSIVCIKVKEENNEFKSGNT